MRNAMLRRLTIRTLTGLALLFAAPAVEAAPLADAAAIGAAAAAASPVQTVACARYGWRGFGVYPGCWRPRVYAPGYVVAAPYYAPPVYVAPVVRAPRRCWISGAWRRC